MSSNSVRLAWLLGVSVTLTTALSFAQAEDPCAAFTWDVRDERALFGTEPQPLTGGGTVSGAPLLAADRLYQLKLREQSEVQFLEAPGTKAVDSGAYAGLARLKVDTTGVYRIALDQRLWSM